MSKPSKSMVSIVHTPRDVEDDEVVRMCERALEPLGGIRAFVREGDHVVLKPNQTVWFLATDGITTDPRVVAAMVALCRRAGADRVTVGDSSGGDTRTSKVMEATGVTRYAFQAGADEVVAFEDLPQEALEIEWKGEPHACPVPKLLLDADAIINLPKAKTHFYDPVSCALKNYAGLPYQKARPSLMRDGLIQPVMAKLHQRLPSKLHLVDGLWAGEGTGPVTNDPIWLGCIVAGTDPTAVDVTVCRLLSQDPGASQFVAAAREVGLGEYDVSRIDVVGANVDDVRVRAKPPKHGFDHLPIRVLQGEGVTWAGSLGHFKSIAETFEKYHFWSIIDTIYGKPTFMIGRVEDPRFEEHVKQGPYFVIDDAADDKYRTDPRVVVVPGSPATHNIFPYIFRRLAVPHVGPAALHLKRVMEEGASWFHYQGWQGPRPPPREEHA